MKISTRILFLFLGVSLSFFCYGQATVPVWAEKNESVQLNKLQIPSGFMAGLHPVVNQRFQKEEEALGDFTYHIDTAVVQAGGEFSKRYIYSYDTAGNATVVLSQTLREDVWTNSSLDTMTYDSVGNKLTDLVKVWNNGMWENLSLEIFRYIENRKVSSKVSKVWENNQWSFSDSSYYYYDINDNVAAAYSAVWVDSLSSWVNQYFNLYSYDSMGYRQFSVHEQWMDSTWVNTQKIIFFYDSVYNLTQGLILYWGDTSWVNYYRENYFYDSVKNKIAYTGQEWNIDDSIWINDLHYDYGYNIYNQLDFGIGKMWDDSIWQNFEKGEYTYNQYGGIETYLYQQWFDRDSIWQNSSMTLYSYDSVGNAYQGKFFTWDTIQQNWIQNQSGLMQIFYNYSTLSKFYTGYQVDVSYNKPLSTGIVQPKNTIQDFACIPNPSRNHTLISLDIKNKDDVGLVVYDITGRKVANIFRGVLEKGEHKFNLKTYTFRSGLYFVSVYYGNKRKTIKLIVENN